MWLIAPSPHICTRFLTHSCTQDKVILRSKVLYETDRYVSTVYRVQTIVHEICSESTRRDLGTGRPVEAILGSMPSVTIDTFCPPVWNMPYTLMRCINGFKSMQVNYSSEQVSRSWDNSGTNYTLTKAVTTNVQIKSSTICYSCARNDTCTLHNGHRIWTWLHGYRRETCFVYDIQLHCSKKCVCIPN